MPTEGRPLTYEMPMLDERSDGGPICRRSAPPGSAIRVEL
jgi:hypothetical protein